jgi:hypothetical protein
VRVEGAHPPPFTVFTITYKVVVYVPAERANTLPLFLLYNYMYSVAYISGTLRTSVRAVTSLVKIDVSNIRLPGCFFFDNSKTRKPVWYRPINAFHMA